MNTFPITSHLQASFRTIGATVRAVAPRPAPRIRFPSWSAQPPASRRINVDGDTFELTLPASAHAVVLDCRRDEQHLVLSLQEEGAKPERFLCGFDERHWFAAAVTGHTVAGAKDSLMPAPVREAVRRAGLRHAERFRRHTRAFIRQGEWFFVPEVGATVTSLSIRRQEPLIRPGGGKAHIVEELARGQGEMVWHHAKYAPNGINDAEFARHTEWPRREGWSRRTRITDGVAVLARGAVRHPDHATIHLNGWHRVHINSEVRPASLGFLD